MISLRTRSRSRWSFLDAVTREVRWSATADGPGAVRIPGQHETNGGKPVAVRVTYGNGKVVEMEPGDA